jgi:hypothetical protein
MKKDSEIKTGVEKTGTEKAGEQNENKNKNTQKRDREILDELPESVFKEEIENAFKALFGLQDAWSKKHFFVCRALVREKMPSCVSVVDRRASLRLMRRNSLMPTALLAIAGIIAGFETSGDRTTGLYWSIGLIVLSLVGGWFIIWTLWKAEQRQREREVREVCAAFLVVYNERKASQSAQIPQSSGLQFWV